MNPKGIVKIYKPIYPFQDKYLKKYHRDMKKMEKVINKFLDQDKKGFIKITSLEQDDDSNIIIEYIVLRQFNLSSNYSNVQGSIPNN